MNVELKNLPNSQVEMTITVPHTLFKSCEQKAMEEIRKNAKVDGFRVGHVPEAILREKISPQAIKNETLEQAFIATYPKAVMEHHLSVLEPPAIEVKNTPETDEESFVYVAKVSVMPTAKMGDYKKIKVKKAEIAVDDKQVDEKIELVMQRFATWKDVERAAKMGDRAELKFDGFDEKGEMIPNTSSKNHPVILGSNTMIPGFEAEVVGLKVEEEKSFKITFPADYHAKEMQGKTVEFKIKLNRLEEKEPQTLDENMIEQITGQKQSVDAFRESVANDLKKEVETRTENEHQENIVQEIVKITEVELPPVLINQEVDLMIDDRKKQVERQGLQWSDYLLHLKKSNDDVRNELRPSAENRLKARLGIQEIIQAEAITVSDDALQERIKEEIEKFPNAKEAIDQYYADPKNADQLRRVMMVDQLMAMLTQ
ncbi:trigger factor [Candidatus Peregrinibacteria bacterium]|nr:MAG: trigger factor [Candidatus Peregrinibacteria bacterium]